MEEKKILTQAEKNELMEERDDNKNFYDQFDRESPLFHNGDTTPVPIGGQKVPQTMPQAYPEGFDPNAPLPEDPSEKDPKCQVLKVGITSFGDYKKAWAKISDLFVARELAIKKAKKEGEAKLMTKKIRAQINGLKDLEKEFRENEHFRGYEELQNETYKFIETMGTDVEKVKVMKPTVTKFTRHLFKLQKDCMTLLKERKKELNGTAKPQTEEQKQQELATNPEKVGDEIGNDKENEPQVVS